MRAGPGGLSNHQPRRKEGYSQTENGGTFSHLALARDECEAIFPALKHNFRVKLAIPACYYREIIYSNNV